MDCQTIIKNGHIFTNAEFKKLLQSNRVNHIASIGTIIPLNELVERAVKTLKQDLKQ